MNPPLLINSELYINAIIHIDCPEREATYIITNGGINDPEKA